MDSFLPLLIPGFRPPDRLCLLSPCKPFVPEGHIAEKRCGKDCGAVCFWCASCLPEMAEETIILVLRGNCPVSVCPEANQNLTELWNRVPPPAVAKCERPNQEACCACHLGLGGPGMLYPA